MAKLVIVESPTKAGTIKKYLGSGFEVRASMGHIRDLYPSKLSVDVKKDFDPKYTVIKGKEKLVKELTELAEKSDEVYLATDPDREGEAISWHLAVLLGIDPKKTKRVKFNEINKTSVQNGMANPSTIDMDLVNAQQARRILDRLVGYRLSPFISQKIRRGLSAGRVQSVAVRLIVDREEEINAFIPEEYWSITAKLTTPSRKIVKANLVSDENGKVKIENKEQSDAYTQKLDGCDYKVVSVKKGTRKKQPMPPFTTSTLQQDASHSLGFTSKKTMKIAQELYEGLEIPEYGSIGLITYMRTDSLRISDESRNAGNQYIISTFGDKYLPEKPRIYKTKGRVQDGHEAIRPTVPTLTPEQAKPSLTTDQYKLYNLIWKRFISSLMANCIQDTVKVELKAEKEGTDGFCMFSTSGFSVKFDGYTVLYQSYTEEDEKESVLPDMKEGENLKFKELINEQHFTQPPARFTEASLIKTLEETGVGRPSTYASIISTITSKDYVVREKKQLKPTELGTATTKLLKDQFPKIINTKFTAGMESDLDLVESGNVDYIKMLHTFYDDFEDTLANAKESMQGVKIQLEEDQTDIPCEKCGRNMVVKVGRYGKFFACPAYPECKTTKPYVEKTQGECPLCGGAVIAKKSRKGHTFFACSNYPDCTFMTWDVPVADKCPKCGKTLFKARGGVIKCNNADCDYELKTAKSKKSKDDEDDE